jgi:L-serine dehydratase
MTTSVFDIFKIGIGPSSSHTVGPMRAALLFVQQLQREQTLCQVTRLQIELFGSLAATGEGHGTHHAILLGLEGEKPELVDPDSIEQRLQTIQQQQQLQLLDQHCISFNPAKDLQCHLQALPYHPNGMRFTAYSGSQMLLQREYFSIGGGFIRTEGEEGSDAQAEVELPYPFTSCNELLQHCKREQFNISALMLENEMIWRPEAEIREKLLQIWQVMKACTQRGFKQTGVLPGGLKVKRRAPELYQQLLEDKQHAHLPMGQLDWVNLFALSVSEENAAGGRVVTAPTNGAAGIIPAVLHYYWQFCDQASEEGVIRFLLTAGAIGILYQTNASISGAEVGCQGEVGVACSMAAAALTEVLGGSPDQVENAAEIGMEHNLGLTCDPIAGLVQIPCIERNAMGAVKAINATRMALRGTGSHLVPLDKVIKTMRDTGRDMQSKYKETSQGGLAVNVIEC